MRKNTHRDFGVVSPFIIFFEQATASSSAAAAVDAEMPGSPMGSAAPPLRCRAQELAARHSGLGGLGPFLAMVDRPWVCQTAPTTPSPASAVSKLYRPR